MFHLVDNFYDSNDLGTMTLCFMNAPFLESYHSKNWKVFDRLQAYPVYETDTVNKSDRPHHPYQIFKKTFETKTNIKPLLIRTFFRKIKLDELKKSPLYKKERPHKDSSCFDYAGLVYFNSSFLQDGTKLYNDEQDFEPTAIIGSKVNRCVFYNSQLPHSTPYDQKVEERWVQPFFLVTEESTLEKYNKEYNEA